MTRAPPSDILCPPDVLCPPDRARPRYVGRQHAFRIETSRSQRVFDELAVSASLEAGKMLVIAGLPNPAPSLGRHFFSQDSDGRREQKLLVIRLSQTQHDELFTAEADLPGEVEPAVLIE